MVNERGQQFGISTQVDQFTDYVIAQLLGVLRRQVGQTSVLGVTPDQLVRVQFRRVARELLRDDLGMHGQPLTHQQRLVMDGAAVPHNGQRARQMLLEMLQECHDVLGMDRRVVGQQVEVEIQMADARADRDAADSPNAIAAIPTTEDRRLPTRRLRATNGGGQLEPGFIEENEVGLAYPGLAHDTREFISLPSLDLLLIAFAGPALRLLAGPAEFVLEDLAYVFGMEGDAEIALDQARDPISAPKLVGPAVLLGTIEEQGFEFDHLALAQTGCPARVGLGG